MSTQTQAMTESMPTLNIVVTVDPPSRPITPVQGRSKTCETPQTPQLLSPTFSRSSTTLDASPSTSSLSLCVSETSTLTPHTTYHIYRHGSLEHNFVIHTTPSKALRQDDRDPTLPAEPYDPREAAYFVHSPLVWWHIPPRTLRFGGTKQSPVVCLIEGSFGWRTWRMDFAQPEVKQGVGVVDRLKKMWGRGKGKEKEKEKEKAMVNLNEPGVLDPRGVMPARYRLRSFGILGESGRAYYREQRQRRRASTTPSPSPSIQDITLEIPSSLLPSAPPADELPTHLRPSEGEGETSLVMRWNGWWTREYAFQWRGVEFRWKGTGTVRDEKKIGNWCRFNHLKLCAYLEGAGHEEEGREKENEEVAVVRRKSSFSSFTSTLKRRRSVSIKSPELADKRELLVARYTCVWARCKAGRLDVYDRALEECVGGFAALGAGSNDNNTQDAKKVSSDEETKQPATDVAVDVLRLRHIVIATALCMLQGEKEKRETMKRIAETLLGEVGGVAG